MAKPRPARWPVASENKFRPATSPDVPKSSMRQSQKNNRTRNKNGRKSNAPSVNRVYESSGPEGKVRGTPQQIIEKYQSLARDRMTAGDRVLSENFLQHAEHYVRILTAAQAVQQQRREERDDREDELEFDNASSNDDNDGDGSGAQVSDGMAVIGDDDGGPDIVPTPESLSEPRRQQRRRGDGEEGEQAPRRKSRRPARNKPRNSDETRSEERAADGADAPAPAAESAPREPADAASGEWSDEPAAEAARAAG